MMKVTVSSLNRKPLLLLQSIFVMIAVAPSSLMSTFGVHAALRLTSGSNNDYPMLITLNTTRELASKYGAVWDIQKRQSTRSSQDKNKVQLNVIIYNQEDVDQLDQLQTIGILSYEKQKKQHPKQNQRFSTSYHRSLQRQQNNGDLTFTDFPCYRTAYHRSLQRQQNNGDLTFTDFPCYRTVRETYESMEELATLFSGFVTIKSIGESWLQQKHKQQQKRGGEGAGAEKDHSLGGQGSDIKVMIITAPSDYSTSSLGEGVVPQPTITNSKKRKPIMKERKHDMVVVGGHHSRELPPPEVIMRWAEHLLNNYNIDPDVTWILQRTRIHIIPIANPDGRQIVETSYPLYQLDYRKNAHPYGCGNPSREGVDLNRNYPMWWGLDTGSSNDPCSQAFRGPPPLTGSNSNNNAAAAAAMGGGVGGGPLSEPESSAIYRYASDLFSQYQEIQRGTNAQEAQTLAATMACPLDASGLFIDIHSYGDFVYFPWGYDDIPSPNHKSLLTLSAKLAKPGNYSLWGPEQDGFLYYVSGDATDSLYGIDCVASVGYEVGSDIYASCEELESSILPTMNKSLLYAGKTVSAPYTIPLGPDIVDIDVNITDPTTTKVTVNVSIDALIVPYANFGLDAAPKRSGTGRNGGAIHSVQLFVDHHPDTLNTVGFIMDAKDGLFANAEETATISLNTTALRGRHIFYLRATGRDGNDGAISAVFVNYPTEVAATRSNDKEPLPNVGEEDNNNMGADHSSGTWNHYNGLTGRIAAAVGIMVALWP